MTASRPLEAHESPGAEVPVSKDQEPEAECWGDPALWLEVCRRLCQVGATPGRPPLIRDPLSPRQPPQRLRGVRELIEVLQTRRLVDDLDLGWMMASAGRFEIRVGKTTKVYYCPASGRIRVAGERTHRERGLPTLSRVLEELGEALEMPDKRLPSLAELAARFVRKPGPLAP